MARKVIGGQTQITTALGVVITDYDSLAQMIADHNANYVELYALIAALGVGAGGVLVTDAAPGAGALTAYAPTGFGATTNRLDVVADDLGTQLNDLPIGADNQTVRVRNKGLVGELGLINANAGSTAAKRFSGENDVSLPPGASIEIRYYAGSVNRWIM